MLNNNTLNQKTFDQETSNQKTFDQETSDLLIFGILKY